MVDCLSIQFTCEAIRDNQGVHSLRRVKHYSCETPLVLQRRVI
ncbi:MAG: hypothetical protein OJF47_002925 [Nitrospira sp.]|nr:MAG: hypothetical protein OJF47_002925 [Nitrospira sp.]